MRIWFKRHFWNLRNWHWVSSAICLISMLLFAITGITLNHAGSIEAKAQTHFIEQQVPEDVLTTLQPNMPLPEAFIDWYQQHTQGRLSSNAHVEWNQEELYMSSPRPGGDLWFSLDLTTGDFAQESTNRGTVAYLNDLHKGRHTGWLWTFFMDLFAIGSVIFSLSGLLLLHRYSKARKKTWPLLALGLLLPILVLIMPSHASADELSITLPRPAVAEYHRPYMAAWLADDSQRVVKNIAVLYNIKQGKGKKWLKDLRLWWRRAGRQLSLPIDGVSGATRNPGVTRIALNSELQQLPAGSYTLYVEAVRELGGREVLSIPITLPLGSPIDTTINGESEIEKVQLLLTPATK